MIDPIAAGTSPAAAPAPSPSRLGLHAIACAVFGAGFVAITLESVAAALIWSLASMARLPAATLFSLEAICLVVTLAGGFWLARHALGLAAARARGALV